jgi:hypothetical protein
MTKLISEFLISFKCTHQVRTAQKMLRVRFKDQWIHTTYENNRAITVAARSKA